jgi:formate-dependent nitrite reductase membrane component NrfD
MTTTLYKDSADPVLTDGRDIDTALAELSGEGALQQASPTETHIERISGTWDHVPLPNAEEPTYYARPMLKEPVWEWTIPLYYFVGGAAGASLVIGAAAQLDRSRRLENLMRRCHWAGIIGSAISGGILVLDLGRPERFYNMLRVFRPTSPMNMGAWILSAVSPSAIVAAALGQRRGVLGTFGEISGIASGFAGLGLATYTGVLVANTAVPVWQESRHILPVLFGASAMASAGSILDLAFEDARARNVTYTFGMLGRAAELTASLALEHQIAKRDPLLAKPLKTGFSGVLWKSAAICTGASLLLSVLPGKSKGKRTAANVLGTAGSMLMRYGIHYAGVRSSRDPRAAFRQQRAGTTNLYTR